MKNLTLNNLEEIRLGFLNETKDLLIHSKRIFSSIEQNPNLSELDLILTLTKHIKSTSMVAEVSTVSIYTGEIEKFILDIQASKQDLKIKEIEILKSSYLKLTNIVERELNVDFSSIIDEFKSLLEAHDPIQVK